jgi:hypothetical protein
VTRKVVTPKIDSDALGRLNIDTIDWTVESDEWNPRKGGPVEKLFKALKKSKGNIDKAYAMISSAPHEFVGKTKRDGTKRSKAEIEATLRYRLNRTKWEYGIRTGQHISADPKNRAQYGTGDYATTRKVKPARKVTAKKTAAKEGCWSQEGNHQEVAPRYRERPHREIRGEGFRTLSPSYAGGSVLLATATHPEAGTKILCVLLGLLLLRTLWRLISGYYEDRVTPRTVRKGRPY